MASTTRNSATAIPGPSGRLHVGQEPAPDAEADASPADESRRQRPAERGDEPEHDGYTSAEQRGLELVHGLGLRRPAEQGEIGGERRRAGGRSPPSPSARLRSAPSERRAGGPASRPRGLRWRRSSEESAAPERGPGGPPPTPAASHSPAPATIPSTSATITGPPTGRARRPASRPGGPAPSSGEPHPADDGQHGLPERTPEGREVAAVEHEVDGDDRSDHARDQTGLARRPRPLRLDPEAEGGLGARRGGDPAQHVRQAGAVPLRRQDQCNCNLITGGAGQAGGEPPHGRRERFVAQPRRQLLDLVAGSAAEPRER